MSKQALAQKAKDEDSNSYEPHGGEATSLAKFPFGFPLAFTSLPDDIKGADPFETAYLRGGQREVIKLAVFDLFERGYLEIHTTERLLWPLHRLAISPNHPPLEHLTERERQLLDLFSEPRTVAEVLQMSLPPELLSDCAAHKERLEQKGLLTAKGGLGSQFPYYAALVVLGIVGAFTYPILILAAIVIPFLSRRRTMLGELALKQYQAGFGPLEGYPKTARLNDHDPLLAYLVAVFGPEVLAGSVYDGFAKVAGNQSSSWNFGFDGCSDGCGGDGCGGCGGCGD
jgi:uncharacterized protein (TIGR04222 family)